MSSHDSGGSRAAYKVDRYSSTDKRDPKRKAAGGSTKRPALPRPKETDDAAFLPPVTKQTTKRIQQYEKLAETVRKVGSTFGVKKHDIIDAIERGDLDGSIVAFQRQAYSTVIGLIPLAEQEYKKHRRESLAYALKALIGEARELAQDLAASSDRARLADLIVEETLQPLFKGILQHIVEQNVVTKGLLAGKIAPQHAASVTAHLDDSMKETAAYLQSTYQLVAAQIKSNITGNS